MQSYKQPQLIIKSFSKKDFCMSSFSAKDYRDLVIKNNNLKSLNKLLQKKHKVGKEIGSENYMKKSKYRFLKTVNIGDDFLLDERTIEYCKPCGKVFPEKGEILIVKDGAGEGLGEVCIYPYDNKNKTDLISAGVISIKPKEELKNYIFAFLKSKHFRDFVDLNTAQGSTIRHSKLISLEYDIPFPTKNNNKNPDEVEELVSLIVQNIINKEEKIKEKQALLDTKIEDELKNNQNSTTYSYSYPKISEIKKETRFDTGLYEKEFKETDFLIRNYRNGFFQIPIENFKSGATPSIRIFNPKNKHFKWITPTHIRDEGFYEPHLTIDMPKKNNVNKDCILIINRTSKGKKGEFVGISCFYDIAEYGKGQHNQGLYQVKDYDKQTSLFLVALLNSKVFRKICGNVTIGSKMKEMKSYDFSKLLFPNFLNDIKKEISEIYYNKINKNKNINFKNYLDNEFKRNKELGIFQLNLEIFKLRQILEDLIHKIVMDEKIEISFEY